MLLNSINCCSVGLVIISNSSCVLAFQSLHTKVVCQYQQHYKDGPPTSGDEECLYWIRFLTYHMAKASLFQVTHTHTLVKSISRFSVESNCDNIIIWCYCSGETQLFFH